MEATIEVAGLRKRFGRVQALDGMTFTVRPGRVTGFVGPNGAGKTTTMRVILGLDRPDAGTALVGGRPYRTLKHPLTHLGSLIDASALQPSRSARNHLLWLARSQRLSSARVDEVIGRSGLATVIRRRAGGYSLGMRQRLGIAAALLGDPPVLMLDEPFNGMDPEGTREMRGFLRSLAAEGRAVLVSSHLMSELQNTADHLVIVGRGRVIADTTVADLIAAASGDRLLLRTTAAAQVTSLLRPAGVSVAATAPDTLVIKGISAQRLVAALSEHAIPFTEVSPQRVSLEQAYLDLTRDLIRLVAGTAGLLAVAAVLALAIGTILRNSAIAVTTVIVATFTTSGFTQWLLRITPAAGFAIQQAYPSYPQVDASYTIVGGYYPLPPWAGFAVLCAWAAAALALAAVLLRKRDA